MNVLILICREIGHRVMNALMIFLAVTIAVGLTVFFLTTGDASKQETKRNMRDIGQNLRIIAQETDMNRFWDLDYSEALMPESWVYEFEKVQGLYYAHLTASLVRRIEWGGSAAILTGISAEVSPPGRKKPSMVFSIEPGQVYMGYQLAADAGIQKGDSVSILGKEFTVAQTLVEAGTDDDIRLTMTLSDVQEITNLQGQINEIQAIDCYCQHPDKDTLTVLREQLAEFLPGAKVIKMQRIALARENQRTMIERFFGWMVPSVVLGCGLLVGALFFVNTRDRRDEIGVLRALGNSTVQIASLFIGKAILIGLAAAVIGFAVGTQLSLSIGPDLFKLTASKLAPNYSLLRGSLFLAPAFAVVASFFPAMLAATEDPAATLTRE